MWFSFWALLQSLPWTEVFFFFWDDRHFVKEGYPFGFCSGFVPIIFGHAYLYPWTMPGVLPSGLGCIFHKSGGVLALFTYLIVLKLDGTMKKNEASNMQSPHYIRKANSIPDFCWSSIYPTSRDRTFWTSIANNHLKMLDRWAKIHRLIRSTHGSSANSKSKLFVAMWHACRSKSQNKGELWAQAPTSPVLTNAEGSFPLLHRGGGGGIFWLLKLADPKSNKLTNYSFSIAFRTLSLA